MYKLILILVALGSSIQLFGQKNTMIGKEAKSWTSVEWIDGNGDPTSIEFENLENKVVYILNYQSWCPGCHRVGLPRLKELTQHYQNEDELVFLVIQTVFEGFHINTADKNRETQLKYELDIPFGYDAGSETSYPEIMTKYRTGGTPWVIIIDKEKTVQFSNFHLENQSAIVLLNELIEK